MLVLYPPPESFIGEQFDGYRINSVLGTGGMGIVFKATQLELERQVALKVINPSLAKDEAFLQRFKVEAHALAKIHHPNIVVIYNFRPSEHGFYIAMEYVSGNTLTEYIRSKGKVGWAECILLARQILSALQSTHKAGIIHRDLKPSNILINENNFVKITDFGLAKVKSTLDGNEDSTVSLDTAGTLCYMPPEVVRGLQKVDHRGDIYSVGLTLYAALAGRLPFDKEGTGYEIQKNIVEKTFPPVKKYAPEIPRELSRVIMKAIEKEPHKRYQSAAEMLQALEAINPVQLAPRKTFSFSPVPIASSTATTTKPPSRPVFVPILLFILVGLVILSFTPFSVANLLSSIESSKPKTLAEQIQHTAQVPVDEAVTVHSNEATTVNQEEEDSVTEETPSQAPSGPVNMSTPSLGLPIASPAKQPQQQSSLPPTRIASANTGSIRVISSPAKADVYLNDKFIGRTPLFLDEIPSGSHEMTIKKEHHEPLILSELVSPLKITFIDGKLTPILGFLHLDISPPSDVYLNGKKVSIGYTAILEQELLATTHELSITHPLHGEWARSITVTPGDTTRHILDFSKKIKVSVTAFDASNKGVHAEILLDNKKTGKYTPAQLSISPGKHLISVQLDGYDLTNESKLQNYDATTTSPLRFTLKKND